MPTAARSRYGRDHQNTRAQLQPLVDAGYAQCREPICLYPTRWIQPGTPWDLAHDRVHGGYLGPAHAKCNRTEGAKRSPTRGWGNLRRRRRARW
jgi:hypothetical protein